MLLVAAATLWGVGCSDSTAPAGRNSGTIAITAASQYPTPEYFADGDTSQAVRCAPKFVALASGAGAATWTGAKVFWYFGAERKVPNDSSTISGQDVSNAWGGPTIAAGASASSSWTFTAGLPFSATMVFRYAGKGGDGSATVSFTCGPRPDTTVAAPALDPPTLTASSGDLQPGDTIQVTYHATAAAGLWESLVALTGACSYQREFPEGLQGSVTRTVTIVLPATCRLRSDLGTTELGIAAAVVDPFGRPVTRTLATGRYLVDKKPPIVEPLFFGPRDVGQTDTRTLAGDWFVGDSLRVELPASDNHALAMLYWEESVSRTRDSMPAGSTSAFWATTIRMPAAWLGPVRFRFWARDSAGNTSDTLSTAVGAIDILPTVDRATRVATVNGDVEQVVYDAKRGVAYLVEGNAMRVAVLSLSSMTLVRTFDFGFVPTSADLTAGGDSLVVTLPYDTSLAVVDLTDAQYRQSRIPITARVPGSGQAPVSVRVLANGHAFVALFAMGSMAGGSASILDVDLAAGTQRARTDAGRTTPAQVLERSGDRRVLMVNDGCLERYDVATDAFTACRTDTPVSWGVLTDATGAHVAMGLYLYDGSFTYQRMVTGIWGAEAPNISPFVALSPDGSALYQVNWYVGIVRNRTSDGATIDRSPVTGIQPGYIIASEDGTLLFLVESSYGPTSKVAVMDMR